MTAPRTKPTGLVLAGGQSRRMSEAFASGHGDKGLLEIGGKPMLVHVFDRLAPQVGRMVINANGDPRRFAAFGLPVISDTVEGYAGPLAGILVGLRWTKTNVPDATHIVSVSSDAPFIPSDLVEKLQAGLAGHTGMIAIARSGGELHPVIGCWPVVLADDLEAALRSGMRKVLAWTDQHGTVPVEFPSALLKGRYIDPFFNANTPEELAVARSLLAE